MNRKQAIKEFKEKKVEKGVFALRCTATGEAWVDSFPNIGAARNQTWFALRTGAHRDKSLQSAFNSHGEPAFAFEVLETLEEDVAPMLVRDLLQQKKGEWAVKLNARTIP